MLIWIIDEEWKDYDMEKEHTILVGGGGGGRPGMAQAGGKNPAGIPEALKKALETVEEQTR